MASTIAVSQDGSRIQVTSTGHGPGVVVLHGAGISVREYDRLAARWSGRLTVHLYNRRGRSGSAPLTGHETAATDLQDLAAVLEATGAQRVFGHSGGAFVAMQAGLHLPVTHIAVYDPAVAVAGCDFPRDFVRPFEQALARGDRARAVAIMSADINREDAASRLPFTMQVLLSRGFLKTPIGKRMADLLPTIGPELHRILDAEGPASQYSGITARVLLARGARSASYYGPMCDALAGAIPGATTLVIPHCSHNAANIATESFARPFAEFFT
jgi:pimeloyl-ACP methyl ester carboxylesterase